MPSVIDRNGGGPYHTHAALLPRHCGWHCMARSSCCSNVYLCLVVCHHRARLSTGMRHQHISTDTGSAVCRRVEISVECG